MAWSDYIKIDNPQLTPATAGIEALIMAVNERAVPFGVEPLEVKKLQLFDYHYDQDPIFPQIENTISYLAARYLKSEFVENPENIEIDFYSSRGGFYKVHSNNTWQDTATICAYLGEEEIKYNVPLSTKFSAAWLRQKIKIVNLFTVARYNPDTTYPCAVLADREQRIGSYYDYDNNYEQYVTYAISQANNRTVYATSGFWVESYSLLYKNTFQSSKQYAYVYSRRSRIYNANSVVSKSYDIVVIAQARLAINDNNIESCGPYMYDAGDSGWIENEKFTLGRLRAENGVAEKTDWFGYLDFFPRPVPTPIVNEYGGVNAHRGYRLDCAIIIDFRVPGGFEFLEETLNI